MPRIQSFFPIMLILCLIFMKSPALAHVTNSFESKPSTPTATNASKSEPSTPAKEDSSTSTTTNSFELEPPTQTTEEYESGPPTPPKEEEVSSKSAPPTPTEDDDCESESELSPPTDEEEDAKSKPAPPTPIGEVEIENSDKAVFLEKCAESMSGRCGEEMIKDAFENDSAESKVSKECCIQLVEMGYGCHRALLLQITEEHPKFKAKADNGLAKSNVTWDRCLASSKY